MSGHLVVDWLPSERLPELQAFIDAEWSHGHVLARDAELLRWQHRFDDERLAVACATEGGRLKGMLGVIPLEGELGGRRGSLAWLTMWIVVPEARPTQLGLALLSFVTDRYEAVGTLGANPRSQRLYQALGFRTSTAIPRWIRVLDPATLARLVPGVAPTVPSVLAPAAPGLSIRDWERSDAEAWDRGWNAWVAGGFVGTRRDAAYLEWRYLAHPRFAYRLRVAERAGEPVALMVHRLEIVRDTDIPVVRVVDALGEADALAALSHDLVASGLHERAAFADFSCTSDRPRSALAAAGFVLEESTDMKLPSRFQPLEAEAAPISYAFKVAAGTPSGDVYLTRSDADMDRPS